MGKGKAIAGFVLGIVGIVFALLGTWFSIIGLPIAITGLCLSVAGGKALKANNLPSGIATAVRAVLPEPLNLIRRKICYPI